MTYHRLPQQLLPAEKTGFEPPAFNKISEGVESTGVKKILPVLALRYVVYVLVTIVTLALFFVSPPVALAGGPASMLNTFGRVVIPAIALDSEIVPVGSDIVTVGGNKYRRWATSNNLIGWHNLSAQPGQTGNMVLTGHSDIYARIFRNLKDVEIGNEIIIMSGGKEYRYRVAQKILVREQGASIAERAKNGRLIDPTTDKRLTLVTCANPGATHRLIIIARPVVKRN